MKQLESKIWPPIWDPFYHILYTVNGVYVDTFLWIYIREKLSFINYEEQIINPVTL